MNAKGYNGWTNYETWNAALWMDNDEGSHEYWNERTEAACDQENDDDAIYQLSEEMKDRHTENAPDLGCSFYADMLGAALSEVDWYEIAENRVTDYRRDNPREVDEDSDEDESPAAVIEDADDE